MSSSLRVTQRFTDIDEAETEDVRNLRDGFRRRLWTHQKGAWPKMSARKINVR